MSWNKASKTFSILASASALALGAMLLFPTVVNAQSYRPVTGWRYLPQSAERWESFQNFLNQKEFKNAAEVIESYLKEKDASLQAEKDLALSQYCLKKSMKGCAVVLSMDIARRNPGSSPAQMSWVQIEKAALESRADEEEITRLINLGNFTEVPEELMGFMQYHIALDNMKKGLYEWSSKSVKQIPEGSSWYLQLEFLKLLDKLKTASLNEVIEKLIGLEVKAERFPNLKNKFALQRARLLFEARRMQEAEDIYAKFLFAGRETGRALLERAWIRYLDKDYSVALGMIESLKSPYFSISINPEQHILAMLAYRDLCHYPSVKDESAKFSKRFSAAIEHIRQNKPLYENRDLMWMTLQKSQHQPEADLISDVRADIKALTGESEFSDALKKSLIGKLQAFEADLKRKMQKKLARDLEAQAEKILDVADQAKLIDYISSLDEYRLKKAFEQRSYKSEKIETLAIDKLYWPVENEYWWTEMNHYRVLISDRCEGAKR